VFEGFQFRVQGSSLGFRVEFEGLGFNFRV
jgi:hypothetical protein